MLKYLDILGFNTFRLMPDLASAAVAIKEKIKADGKVVNKNYKFTLDNVFGEYIFG